jgi:hypothetical protein
MAGQSWKTFLSSRLLSGKLQFVVTVERNPFPNAGDKLKFVGQSLPPHGAALFV